MRLVVAPVIRSVVREFAVERVFEFEGMGRSDTRENIIGGFVSSGLGPEPEPDVLELALALAADCELKKEDRMVLTPAVGVDSCAEKSVTAPVLPLQVAFPDPSRPQVSPDANERIRY